MKSHPPDPLRDAVDGVVDGRPLVSLGDVAELLGLSREAVRDRVRRGTLRVRTIRAGGATAGILVPACDVYELLGLEAS